MSSYISEVLSQKYFLKHFLCCSILTNDSKEKQAVEQGGCEDLQVQGVPPTVQDITLAK